MLYEVITLNTSAFTNGAIVDANPLLIAHIFDESGINTSGNSIGHSYNFV